MGREILGSAIDLSPIFPWSFIAFQDAAMSFLWGTYMKVVASVREGERRTTSEFPPEESMPITRDRFSQERFNKDTAAHSQRERKLVGK